MFKTIEQFEVGEEIQGYYLVKQSAIKNTAAGKKYMDATLMDASGEINAKIWDGEPVLLTIFKEGEIIKVSAKVNSWQGQKQLSVHKYRPINPSDDLDVEKFVPSAPIKAEILYDNIFAAIDAMKNEDIKRLVKALIVERKEKFMFYPAAKSNHHAVRAGLMYHIYRMLELGKAMAGVYPEVNLDLLKAGIILHDLCKIDEMATNALGLVSEYTKEGNFLGHITIGIQLIGEKGKSLHIDEEVVLLIQHMLLSHHYFPEYGSPKKPMFLEAELLHHIDMIDARIYDIGKAVRDTPKGEFSEPVWSMEKRRLYNHGL
ncbi:MULTISPECIES: 3'-5' exoribonuclease YhaM family protein [unclassified Fusibacter]|uniref:3'-5' exoribonuclease YhaM family protein n=1 Tax=unclassified Fusibacter TaxID=2624464 RepID=UPI0010134954|nr:MULTISPECIES: HD domain-containing protein [unclassified Fusibacter]MCK8061375.1 HD domain-containing protein [Fusibacter sp. A2]NPE23582.1 HD domain-containing protein [Fusibacter sp. A1]RXV58991.1 HD domain-containing protein [Fusibacter sp. A1]